MKLKFNFNFDWRRAAGRACVWALPAATAFGAQAPLPATGADGGAAQRLVSLVDYVAGDYRRAVKDGAVLATDEYQEQQRFSAEIVRMGRELLPSPADDRLLASFSEIESLVARRADPDEVARACRDAHDLAVSRFGLETRPLHRPSLPRAQELYALSCAACHGAHGDADTERARALDPQPASFRSPERLRDLSPYRVYNALTFGISGTAMPAFDVLTPQERWDLAFYVLQLGHDEERALGPVEVALADLATQSDRELLVRFAADSSAPADARLAWARQRGPYVEPPTSADLARTREMLREAMGLFGTGRVVEANGRVLDAYLQGFEPAEPRLRVRDSDATQAVELAFHDLRSELLRGDALRVRARAQRLDDALSRLSEEQRPLLPFVAAALIYLREGLEAALLVGALLAGVARLGLPRAARFIHAGWLLALPAGVATWWIMARLLAMGAHQRELLEAAVSLLAAAVLFSVSFWMISKAESQRWSAYLQKRLEASLGRRNLLLLTGLAFLAAYREAAEAALFTQALLLEAKGHSAEVWGGALAGLLAVASIAFLMSRTVMRLPIVPFFGVSSVLLLGLAVSFAGSGIYELVSAGYLRPRPVSFPAVPWLGIHPDLTVLALQLTIVSIVALAGVSALRRSAVGARGDDRRERGQPCGP